MRRRRTFTERNRRARIEIRRSSGSARRSSGSARRVCLALAVALATWISIRVSPGTPTELVVEPPLLTRLQTLAEGLHKEIVLCLRGDVRGDRAIVSDFVMPIPRLSTPTRSSFERCPAGTLASWHNHPRASESGPVAAVSSPAGARRLCVLSETDIQTAERLRHPFVVVSVDAETWCWWGLDEVDRFAARAISPAPPSPERIMLAMRPSDWARPGPGQAARP